MISNTHYIELYIHGELIELENQESLGLRINNVLFDPTKTSTSQAEYSYSFDIPSTPNNDRILNYANNLSRINKFHARYDSQVYADGKMIFDGSLTIQKYDAKEKMYTCNLVNIKINSLDEIFGDTVMTDLKWMIDFSGGTTINEVNANYDTKYYFPLVSYGVFQKTPVTTDEVSSTYTAKHDLDKYNKWWVESFYPSLNVVETMRKAFEYKGYTVGGNVFSDPYISNIYASCNLADGQVPQYNLGNQMFGSVSLRVDWNNYQSIQYDSDYSRRSSRSTFASSTGGLSQELKFPYGKVSPAINASNRSADAEYNFDTIDWWNMMDSTNNSAVTVTVFNDTYMYDPNEMVIVIPADGWYHIELQGTMLLSGVNTSFISKQWTTTYSDGDEFNKDRDVQFTRTLLEHTPIEIQVVRNIDENIELIKGKTNIVYATGDVNQETYTYRGGSYTGGTYTNKTTWSTDCPHQNPYGSKTPTKTTDLVQAAYTAGDSDIIASTAYTRTGGASTSGGMNYSGNRPVMGGTSYNTYGYMHRDNYVMPFDQAVSESFICGLSSLSNGTMSVMRNGRSWSKISGVKNQIFADVLGMDLVNKADSSGGTTTVATEYCKNTYKNSSNYCWSSDEKLDGRIECCVWLNRNDILELVAIQREFEYKQTYACSGHCYLDITAISDKTRAELEADSYFGALSTTTFPKRLNLFNFTNQETKVSDWISNVQKAFNLNITQDGTNIDINTNMGIKKTITNAVDIDDRVNSDEVESQYISYPREMSVKYKIDTDEWGYELTVPEDHINEDDWADWGDSGFTVIQLSDDTYETKTQNTQTNFSYTYYDNFLWKDVLEDGTESDYSGLTITIPVIEKAEYMAEGYGYDEAMAHDGYGQTQRFWYRDQISQEYVWLADHMHEKIYLSYPMNSWEGFNLSYKDTEKSIVSEYFNISPMLSSNYVTIDVHLTPDEYNQIKSGALVHFDSDLYYTSQISGYDPSGGNTTELKLIKKT